MNANEVVVAKGNWNWVVVIWVAIWGGLYLLDSLEYWNSDGHYNSGGNIFKYVIREISFDRIIHYDKLIFAIGITVVPCFYISSILDRLVEWFGFASKTAKGQFLARRISDEEYYEQASSEIKKGIIRQGLWAKAWSSTGGDESKTKALYIKLLVSSMKSGVAKQLGDN